MAAISLCAACSSSGDICIICFMLASLSLSITDFSSFLRTGGLPVTGIWLVTEAKVGLIGEAWAPNDLPRHVGSGDAIPIFFVRLISRGVSTALSTTSPMKTLAFITSANGRDERDGSIDCFDQY